MTGRIFFKLTAGVVCLLLMALIAVDFSATSIARENYISNLTRQLADKCAMLAFDAPPGGAWDPDRARELARAADARLTVIDRAGKVLADSGARPAAMENHRSRPEVIRAMQGQTGSNVRLSATIGVDFLYVAVPFDGGVIRLAVPLADINRQVSAMRRRILAGTALAFLPAVIVAALLARWLSKRFAAILAHASELAKGNFRARLPQTGGSEFGQLGQKLNETAEKLGNAVEQLQREHAELERVERVRKDFVTNVSHELRTPLASIQGYTETLIDGAVDDPQHNQRFLGIIRHNAERLARLTADLLTLSQVEQRRQKFTFEPLKVNELLREAIELMRPIAAKREIRLDLEPLPENAISWCDGEAVSQILSNLLDNAIKYTPPGGSITLGGRPAGRFHEVFVRDTGIGIPEEDLPRLFERFYRVDKARSRALGGTGLGLAIVKHLVAAHNGLARVESRPNRGSTFFFTLPAEEAALDGAQVHTEFTAP